MKASLKQALSIGLMATFILPFALPVVAETNSGSATAEKKDDKKQDATPASAPAKKPALVNVQGMPARKPLSPYAEVDARMVRIERRLVEDLATGRLTAGEAAEFKKALDRIAELETHYRAQPAKFTHWQNVRLHVFLDKLADELTRSEHDRDLASADLQFTREDIWHRIDLASRQGRLTPNEVADLKQRFNRINALEAMLHRQQGNLTYADKMMLCVDYDHLAQLLQKRLNDRPLALPDVSTASAGIEKRLEEASKAGKLSQTQVQEYKQSIVELRNKAEAAKKPGAHLSEQEILALGEELDGLANKIEAAFETSESLKDLDARLKNIDHRLAVYLSEGSLNPLETLELKEDLDEIRSAKEKIISGGKTLQAEDEIALKLDTGRLEGRLDRQLHGPNRLWSGTTVNIAHLSHRAVEASRSKRLAEEESKSIRRDLSVLNKKAADLEKAEGGMTAAQALQIAGDLSRLSGRLEMSMKDREMQLPNIDGQRQAIDNRIGEAAVLGHLTAGDARSAVLSLAEINSVKERYHTSENELSPREKFAVAFELERLSAGLEEQMRGHEASFPGLDTRRSQIEELINEGISSGRLNESAAEYYRKKLVENKGEEKQYRSDALGLTGDKALQLVSELEKLWEQLDRELRDKRVTTSDLVSLEGNVEKKIRQGFSYGLLSPLEAQLLRSNYDGVVAAFNKMRAEEGGLSYGERLAFAYGFQRLMAIVERNLHSSPMILPSLEERRYAIEQKLGNLVATGRIPLKEAQDLKGLLDELEQSAAEKRRSGGGMSYQEILLVTLDLDRLNRRVDQRAAALKNPLPDVDAIQSDLEKRIEQAKASGKINNAEYNAYKADMARVATNEAAFRVSEESLNYAEAVNLLVDLERLKGKLESGKKLSDNSSSSKQQSKTSKTKK